MKRKEFLLTSGMLLTTAMLAAYTMPRDGTSNDDDVQKNRRPNPDDFKDPVLKAITIGMNAPNPHNTQAWKFKIVNANEALLYVDEKKILPATDPPARQIHIGWRQFRCHL